MVGELKGQDKCPCNSEKEYQNCCKSIISRISSTAYKQDYILNDFIKGSKEFDNYFKDAEKSLKKPIFWGSLPPKTPNHIKIREFTSANGNHIIAFKNIPPKDITPSILAHEIEHIVLKDNSYPYVIISKINSSFINSMLQDPLIYNKLENVGFDAISDFNNNLDKLLNECGFPEKPKPQPTDYYEAVKWILTYSQIILINKNLSKSNLSNFEAPLFNT